MLEIGYLMYLNLDRIDKINSDKTLPPSIFLPSLPSFPPNQKLPDQSLPSPPQVPHLLPPSSSRTLHTKPKYILNLPPLSSSKFWLTSELQMHKRSCVGLVVKSALAIRRASQRCAGPVCKFLLTSLDEMQCGVELVANE